MWVAALLVCGDEDDVAACLVDLGVVLLVSHFSFSKFNTQRDQLSLPM